MKIEVRATGDGSKTIYLPHLDETYHSHHGAVQEAIHVFIKNGIKSLPQNDIKVFELGFGTGLNAILTQIEAEIAGKTIEYSGIEAFPVAPEIAAQMQYEDKIGKEWKSSFDNLHVLSWNDFHQINSQFSFRKIDARIEDFDFEKNYYDIIFFDAFGPRAQGELWKVSILEKMHQMLKTRGVFVTYCAMGQFKRDLKSLGFVVESLPGPPGKREMTRATKI